MKKRRIHHLVVYALCCLLITYNGTYTFVYAEDLLVNFFELYSGEKLPPASTKENSKKATPVSSVSPAENKSKSNEKTTSTQKQPEVISEGESHTIMNDTPTVATPSEDVSDNSTNIGMQDIDKETLVGPSGNPIFGNSHEAAPDNIEEETRKQPLEELYEGLVGPSGNPIDIAAPNDGIQTPDKTTDTQEIQETITDTPSDIVEAFIVEESLSLKISTEPTSDLQEITHPTGDELSGPFVQAVADFALTVEPDLADHIVIIPENTSIKTSKFKRVKEKDLDIRYPAETKTDLFDEPILQSVAFGIPDTHLIFSKPVEIHVAMDPALEGEEVRIYVLHNGDEKYTDRSLTTDPDASCMQDGTTPFPQNTTLVQGGYARMYACGASTFVVTYSGGATPENFVDNGSLTKNILVTTGDIRSGSLVQNLQVTIDFHAIDGTDPTNPRPRDSKASEISMHLTSPQGTEIILLGINTYTDGETPRVRIVFDDTASVAPSGIPSSGTFLPVESLDTFNGENALGTRIFTISDNAYDDGAILYEATLDFISTDCGNSSIEAGETCDDGNTANNDGCNAGCTIEAGRECTGQPSSCSAISTTNGLRVHLDGSSVGTTFTDISGNDIHGTGFNTVTTSTVNGETVMCFNGSNEYIEINTGVVSNYPFSVSTRIKSDNVSSVRGFVSMARSTSASIMYNIEHSSAAIRARAQNTTARYASKASALNTSNRVLVTAVFNSSTNRQLYINGLLQATNTSTAAFDTNTSRRRNIGRFADSTPSNYFDGCLDDVRIYDTGLSSSEVYTLYARPASITTSYTTNASPALTGTVTGLDRVAVTLQGTTYTGTNQGDGTRSIPQGTISPSLTNGVYPLTLHITTPYDTAVNYSGSLVVQLPVPQGEVGISAPGTFAFTGSLQTTATQQMVEQTSTNYFSVSDTLGADEGYYTTLSLNTLSGTYASLSTTAIERKGSSITTLSGSTNGSVVLGNGFTTYAPATGTVTFIKRDPASNNGVTGTYGSQLQLRLTLPAYTRPDTYQGTLTFTLYEN